MPPSKSFDRRKIKLNEYLRNNLHLLTLDDMVDRLITDLGLNSLDKRTVQNDLKHLREECGAPIKSKKLAKGVVWFYDDPNFSIDKIPVDQEELNVLQSALDIIIALKIFKLSDSLQELVIKLKRETGIDKNNETEFIQFETNEHTEGLKYIDPLLEAIKGETVIEIVYQRFVTDEKRTFMLHPYLLKEYRNRWYVLGLVDDKNKMATFALDRIIKIKPLLNPYKPNIYFNPKEYFHNLIGISRKKEDKPERIILKVTKEQLPYFETQQLHHTQQIKYNEDGSGLLEYNLIINFELKQLLLSFTGTIEILEPHKLTVDINNSLNKRTLKLI